LIFTCRHQVASIVEIDQQDLRGPKQSRLETTSGPALQNAGRQDLLIDITKRSAQCLIIEVFFGGRLFGDD
jgi:hypothetical protein